jgi:hypothetical protein
LRRLFDRREELFVMLREAYFENFRKTAPEEMKNLEARLADSQKKDR